MASSQEMDQACYAALASMGQLPRERLKVDLYKKLNFNIETSTKSEQFFDSLFVLLKKIKNT